MASTIQVGLIFLIGSCAYLTGSYGATFTIQNNCPYTVWPAFLNPNGGFQLSSKQKMVLTVAAGTKAGRIWARTGCSFNGGRGSCATGDCGGLLSCQASGAIPTTLVEYTLNGDNNQDFYDISLVDGFNVPVSVTPSPASGGKCITTACLKDVNADCPSQLKTNGGCKSACAAFPTNDQYCCRGQFETKCPSSTYSQFFKNECPQAYSYAKDDSSSTFVCPGGRDYTIAFCQ